MESGTCRKVGLRLGREKATDLAQFDLLPRARVITSCPGRKRTSRKPQMDRSRHEELSAQGVRTRIGAEAVTKPAVGRDYGRAGQSAQ